MTNSGTTTEQAGRQADEHEQGGHEENVPIRHVQTVPIRHDGHCGGKGRFHVSITPAIRAAGLDDNGMFRFIPEEADELGVVPALGSEEGEGQMRDNRTYSVTYTGSKEHKSYRLTIPDDALAALGIDTDHEAAKAGDLQMPLLDVYVGDYMIAFDKSPAISLAADELPDGYESEAISEGDNADKDIAILEKTMATTPLVRHSGGPVTAKLTTAIRKVGEGDEDEFGAVEYHPDRGTDLDGIVPVTLHEMGYGYSGDGKYALQRVAGNSGASSQRGFEATIPDDVLDALSLSRDNYEDVPIEERPSLIVYAGDDLLALGRPGEREIAVDRSRSPGERPTTLTDIDGIGDALAPRLTAAGYETIEDLADASREDLLEFDQLNETRADSIIADVSERMGE